jgi:hypothetical protein
LIRQSEGKIYKQGFLFPLKTHPRPLSLKRRGVRRELKCLKNDKNLSFTPDLSFKEGGRGEFFKPKTILALPNSKSKKDKRKPINFLKSSTTATHIPSFTPLFPSKRGAGGEFLKPTNFIKLAQFKRKNLKKHISLFLGINIAHPTS